MITISCTLMFGQHIQSRWHRIKTRKANLINEDNQLNKSMGCTIANSHMMNSRKQLEKWFQDPYKARYLQQPFLLEHGGQLQLTPQFCHTFPCLGCIVKQIHCKGLNTLLYVEDREIEQEIQAAKHTSNMVTAMSYYKPNINHLSRACKMDAWTKLSYLFSKGANSQKKESGQGEEIFVRGWRDLCKGLISIMDR